MAGADRRALVLDPVFKFGAEALDGRDDGPGRRVAQAAVGTPVNLAADVEQQVNVAGLPAAGGDAVEYLIHPARAFAAGRALPTGLVHVELGGALHQQHDIRLIVENHEAAGAEQRAVGLAAFIIEINVGALLGGHDLHGRPARNDGLELAARDAARDLDQLHQWRAQLDLVVGGPGDMPADGHDLGAFALLCAVLGVLCAAVGQNPGRRAVGLHVVNQRRRLPDALDDRQRGVRGLEAGIAALAHQAAHQRRLLAALVAARAQVDIEIVIEALDAENVLAQVALLVGLINGLADLPGWLHVLPANIDVALLAVGGVSGDDHAFHQQMGQLEHQFAVFIRARLAFVGITDDIMGFIVVFGQTVPFDPGGEAGAAAPAQAGGLDLVYDRLPLQQNGPAQPSVPAVLFIDVYLFDIGNVAVLKQKVQDSHRCATLTAYSCGRRFGWCREYES